MAGVRLIAPLFVAGMVATSAARPVGESDTDFIARTISAFPMSQGSYVTARLTDCVLIIDQTIPGEKKRTVLPLMRLDERSFEVVQDAEWGWFVEVHTQQRRRDINTGTAKWSDRLAEFYIYVYDQKNAERLRDALMRVVRSCRQGHQKT
jgi:hypothetical protein